MSTLPFPLQILADVAVSVSPQGAAVPTFNQALIIGNSDVIPTVGAGARCRLYLSTAAMISDGFDPNDPEVLAAGIYFEQNPSATFLWIGAQDTTALKTVSITTGGHAGTGYAVGDFVTPTQGGSQGGKVKITTIGGSGAVTGVEVVDGIQGTGYALATGLPTTSTGAGTGLELDITAIGETVLQALTACRLAQPAWYLAMATTATDADDIAVAPYVQTATPQMQWVYSTSAANALNGVTGNVFSVLKAGNYSRMHGAYSTTQGGAAPGNAYFAAAIMGIAMGLNNGRANSNFTLAAKTLVGVNVEPITPAQANVFGGTPGVGTGNNGNYYVNWGNVYDFYYQGINANGTWFDQIVGLDMLAADVQISILNVLASLPSIPQNNAGQALVLSAANAACARAAGRGFLSAGVWTGPDVLNVTAGTSLPAGFRCQSESFQGQSPTDKALRKGMPVYITVILAGSQQSFTIQINVQQ